MGRSKDSTYERSTEDYRVPGSLVLVGIACTLSSADLWGKEDQRVTLLTPESPLRLDEACRIRQSIIKSI